MKLDFTRYSLGFVMLAAMCLVSGFVQSGCDKRAPVAGDFKKAVENEKPASAVSKDEFEGCTLIEPPKEIAAQDVAFIRNYLKRESSTGKWDEIDWEREVVPAYKGNQADSLPTGVLVTLALRTKNESGNVNRYHVSIEYRDNKPDSLMFTSLTIGPIAINRSAYLTTSISPE